MRHIDEKFKDNNPVATVEKIRGILQNLGIEVQEKWNDSGVENCYSVHVSAVEGVPGYNGKGVTKEFARASAYAEFMERLQSGLFSVKYQSLNRNPEMRLHAYAPDAKYVTVEELIRDGEWMDHIMDAYKDPMITRESIAERCLIYACSNDGKILTIPFYSLFEDKYVYLPSDFVARMYTGNGNCAGNTREEAWVHALSEIMERHASQRMIMKGTAAPQIPEEVLRKFPTVSQILDDLHNSGDFDIAVFDYSLGNGFPIIATRVIDKTNQSYVVNVGADPVLEIAIQRTLTELFQGRSVNNLITSHRSKILSKTSDFPVASNVLNQLHTSDGMYTVDFFANEMTCQKSATDFADNSHKNNKELLQYMLDLYRRTGRPVYVRNYSYLGFPSYKFVVPGFSETGFVHLNELIPEYAIADSVSGTLKNVVAATDDELSWMLNHSNTIKSVYSRYQNFTVNSGVPLVGVSGVMMSSVTRAYASYRLGNYKEAISHMKSFIKGLAAENSIRKYFACVNRYLELKESGVSEDKIRVVLYKFFVKEYPDALYQKLDQGLTPYDDYLLQCDLSSCSTCRWRANCRYEYIKELTAKIGSHYSSFTDGQKREEFAI